MKSNLLTGNGAAAWGARLSRPDFIPVFPITPQTEIIETIAKWVANKEINTDFCPMESEHSVLSAAVAACATGCRTFTATSSQGLALMHEILYIASGMRLPIVMVNVSRGLSAPVTLWCDHNDYISAANAGWLMLSCENNQEVLDSVIMAYKAAEDEDVLLPCIVNMDGFVLSFTREPVQIPKQDDIDKFLPTYEPEHAYLDVDRPMTQGAVVFGEYEDFKAQHQLAASNALQIFEKVHHEWKELTGRRYSNVDAFMCNDADYILVLQGSNATTAKVAALKLRKEGHKVGVLRIRLFRPFPFDAVKSALKNARGIAVFDQNLSPGTGGSLFHLIRSTLYEIPNSPIIDGVIGGLGGRNITIRHFENIFRILMKNVGAERGSIYWL